MHLFSKNQQLVSELSSYETCEMEGEGNFSQVALPLFDGKGYDLWSVRMQSYLEGLDVWDAVEENYIVQPLPVNPTMAQIKNHK